MSKIEMNKNSVILHYASISADALLEKDLDKLSIIATEKSEIEKSLSMNEEEIIKFALQLMSPK